MFSGETCDDPKELVILEECEDCLLSAIVNGVTVQCKKINTAEWRMAGGTESNAEANTNTESAKDDGKSFWYQFSYNYFHGRFETPPEDDPEKAENIRSCSCCVRLERIKERDRVRLGSKLPDATVAQGSAYDSVFWKGMEIRAGDALFLDPLAFSFKVRFFCVKAANN